jgi:succinate dehydrogenase/fumarate reductase flavoprotein subunit
MAPQHAATELAVVGGGMAGLTAAVRATERGANVVVLEKGSRLGGSMALSAGLVWTYESFEAAREAVPDGDPALQRLVVDGLDEGFAWLADHGVTVREPPVELPTGTVVSAPTPGANCGKIEPEEFVDWAETEIADGGNEVRTGTPMTDLRTDEDGRVTGVVARTPEGDTLTVEAEHTLLATGGFQGNEELLQRHVTPHVERLWLRANPWSTGDGLCAAKGVGASVSPGLHTFYGHNLAAPPADVTPERFLDATQYYGPFAVALEASGERFTDESAADLEHELAQDTARLADGRAFYVVDDDIYESEVFSMGHVGTIVERAAEMGGTVLRADSLDELREAFDDVGVDGATAVETLREFNDAVAAGRADRLDPPRRDHAEPVDEPPFRAVEVQPGITFTMGGLSVDENLRVQRRAASASSLADPGGRDATVESTPVPNLYCAGVDVGGVNNRGYMGGLANALVTGKTVAEQVTDS